MIHGSNAERDANKLKLIVDHLQKVVMEKQIELDSQKDLTIKARERVVKLNEKL
jgi:hypothetical protein